MVRPPAATSRQTGLAAVEGRGPPLGGGDLQRGDSRGDPRQPSDPPPGRLAPSGSRPVVGSCGSGHGIRQLRAACSARGGPGGPLGAGYNTAGVVGLAACVGFILLLTPTGSLPSPRWRWWAWVAAVVPLLALASSALLPFEPPYQSIPNPLAVPSLAGPLRLVNGLTWAVTGLSVLVAAGSLVVRFRRARGLERQQLRWLAYGAALTGMAVLALVALIPTGN